MSVLETQVGLMEALCQEMTPKFLATRSAEGIPNVVPCTSIMPAGDVEDRLIFGNFLLRKTVGNLDADPRVGILVITTALEGWIVLGDFLGWQRTGPYVDRLNSTDLLRYNAYTGIRNAGIVQVNSIMCRFRLSKLRVLADYLLARAGPRPTDAVEGAVTLPLPVRDRFRAMSAIRVVAFVDSMGYPMVVPVLSLQPATAGDGKESLLVCAQSLAAPWLETLPAGTAIAANLLTPDVVSFQTKGKWLGSRHFLGASLGAMAVTAVYAGGPPIPGRQVA